MSAGILQDIIKELYGAGFSTVAVVCDMSPTNRKLLKELGITPDKPRFTNPANVEEKVFTFIDAPHLLKLVRNHFLDNGIIYNNSLLSTRTISELLVLTLKSDVSITFKLSEEHLSLKGAARQKVKPAAQLFSHTTASALIRCHTMGEVIYKVIETAKFFQLVNDWLDVLNSKMDTFSYHGKQPYGISYDNQKSTLDRMTKTMSIPLPHKRVFEPFQKGILVTNSAKDNLQKYVAKYGMHYLVTKRLNQDVLEHFFGAIRGKGGLNDQPSSQEFIGFVNTF